MKLIVPLAMFLSVAVLCPIFSEARELKRDSACRTLLEALPKPTNISFLDETQTQAAIEGLLDFQNEVLPDLGDSERNQDSATGSLRVYRSTSSPAQLQKARRDLSSLDRALESGRLTPQYASGRVIEDQSTMLKFISDLGLRTEAQAKLDRVNSGRRLKMVGAGSMAALGIVGAGLLWQETNLDVLGLLAMAASAYPALSGQRQVDYFSDALIVMQRIAVGHQPGEWVYIHGRTERQMIDILSWAEGGRDGGPALLTLVRPRQD